MFNARTFSQTSDPYVMPKLHKALRYENNYRDNSILVMQHSLMSYLYECIDGEH